MNDNAVHGDPRKRLLAETINNFGPTQYVGYANVVNFNSGADSSDAARQKQLMAYIQDPLRRVELVATLSVVRDMKTLCRSVLWDVYNSDLNDLKDKDDIIVSAPFIESFIPLLRNFEGAATVKNIRAGIHKYVFEKE